MTPSHGPLRVGIGGPVGSGKTMLCEVLCKAMRDRWDMAVITNDIYTKEDQRLLTVAGALPPERIMGVETGGCPHTAIREDASINLAAVRDMTRRFPGLELLLIESGGDNLAATFSPELADLTIYVIDVAGGEKIPRKGGPGITRSDLLVINCARRCGPCARGFPTPISARSTRPAYPDAFVQALTEAGWLAALIPQEYRRRRARAGRGVGDHGGDQPLGRQCRRLPRPDVQHGHPAAARLGGAEGGLAAGDRARRAAAAVDGRDRARGRQRHDQHPHHRASAAATAGWCTGRRSGPRGCGTRT